MIYKKRKLLRTSMVPYMVTVEERWLFIDELLRGDLK